MGLELWIDLKNKIASFQEIFGWNHEQFPTKSALFKYVDELVHRQFRFQ